MHPATESRRPSPLAALLAGLQAGMLGVCGMLAWLGISAKWQLRSFWSAENLMASIFYGDRAVRGGFSGKTLSGLAIYLLLYSLLGAGFAVAAVDRLPRRRVLLGSVLFALCWYYLSFQVLWKSLAPLVALLHAARPTVVGHLVYGTFLGRYPAYLPGPEGAVSAAASEARAKQEHDSPPPGRAETQSKDSLRTFGDT